WRKVERVGKRDEGGRLFGSQNPCDPGRLERIALLEGSGLNEAPRLTRYGNRTARDRLAFGYRLCPNVDHPDLTGRADVRQNRSASPLTCHCLPPVPGRTTDSRVTRSNRRFSASRPAAPVEPPAKNSAPP